MEMSRRKFLAMAAGIAAAASAPWRALAHHKPGHGHGPKPSPTPTPTVTPSPSPTLPPPPTNDFGPSMGAQWVRDHAGARPVADPLVGILFDSAPDLQTKLDDA